MSKIPPLTLSDRDKTPKASRWGYDFHHTTPQRRVLCVLGDMLAPRSADDIPPIAPEAMTSVQAAIALLANLVGDQDHGRFLGNGDVALAENHEKARIIAGVGQGLAGILRVTVPSASIEGRELPAVDEPVRAADHALLAEMRQHHAVMSNDERSIGKQREARDLVCDSLGRLLDAYERVLLENMRLQSESARHVGQPPADGPPTGAVDSPVTILPPELVEDYLRRTGWDEPQVRSATFATFRKGLTWLDVPVYDGHHAYPERFREFLDKLSKIESRSVAAIKNDIATKGAPCDPALVGKSPLIDLHVTLNADEVTALSMAREHVRVSMAHQYSWKDRDATMDAISKVHRAATTQTALRLSTEEIVDLTRAHEHVRVSMAYPYGWEVRDAAMSAIGAVLDAHRHAGDASKAAPGKSND